MFPVNVEMPSVPKVNITELLAPSLNALPPKPNTPA